MLNPAPDHASNRPELGALSWDHPLPAAAAAWLVAQAGWSGDGPLDLRSWLVVVPTRQSSRRLREAIAVAAAARGQAVFSPRVIVPEQVPTALADLPEAASRLESTLAWARVLRAVPLARVRTLLPVEPPERDFPWALSLAQRLMRVQGQLNEEGLSFAAVAEAEGNPERERWRQLADLEARWLQELGSQGWAGRGAVESAGLAAVNRPAGVERVAVIGVPDALGIALAYLQRLVAVGGRVEVLVYADPAQLDLAAAFDSWGRPRTEFWSDREMPWTDFNQQVRLMADPAAQAEHIGQLARRYARPDEWLDVALVDPEVRGPLEQVLAEAGLPSYNPEGTTWRRGRLHGLLTKLAALMERPSHDVIGSLLRHPDVLPVVLAGAAEGPAALLRRWDQVREDHLVATLDEALAFAGESPLLAAALRRIATWRDQLCGGEFGPGAMALLAEIYGETPIAAGSAFADAAAHWAETVAALEGAASLAAGLSRAEQWRLAVQVFGEGARFETKAPEALELGGWLELLWADAGHAVIAGANDGRLPEAVVGDAFLPENLRVALGLRSNAQRLARDAYLLTVALASRRGENVTVLVGKTADNGEPLRPSRLLLAGNEAALPARVRRLFRPLETNAANLPWRRAWTLRPERVAPPQTVSVTALRDWLACPFRFYLKRVLRMEPRDLDKSELDARDFGTLVHAALQAMGESPALRDCTDEATLRDGLLDVLEAEAKRTFGAEPSLPLIIQLESARQRLRRVATIEAAERQAGWRTEKVEWEFAVPLGPLTVRGKIDRIDRHADGRVRVIDYKTSDKAKAPLEAHVETLREVDAERPEWLQVEIGGRTKRWVDLQLPLYRRALAAEYGTDLTCAYFNLPKAVGETGLLAWPDDAPELQGAAERCAEAVAAAIGAGEFWPPVEDLARGEAEWATVFHDGIAASVAEDWIRGARKEGGA